VRSINTRYWSVSGIDHP